MEFQNTREKEYYISFGKYGYTKQKYLAIHIVTLVTIWPCDHGRSKVKPYGLTNTDMTQGMCNDRNNTIKIHQNEQRYSRHHSL